MTRRETQTMDVAGGADGSETAARLRARLEEVFTRIAAERMAGLPMVNERVRVEAFGFERVGDWHMGVMLTPWFMNLMLLPAEDAPAARATLGIIGETRRMTLPAGRVDCIVGGEEGVGRWLACSLFSPVFEFADHAAAAETARAALQALLTPPDEAEGEKAPAPETGTEDDAAALEQAFANGFAGVAAGAQQRRLSGAAVPGSERARARSVAERERRATEERARAEAAQREKERRAAREGVDLRRRSLLFGRSSD